MLPLKKKHSSYINGSKSVSSNKEKSHVSIHGDTFNSSGGLNRSYGSAVLIGQIAQVVLVHVQVVVLLVQMWVPLTTPEISVGVG